MVFLIKSEPGWFVSLVLLQNEQQTKVIEWRFFFQYVQKKIHVKYVWVVVETNLKYKNCQQYLNTCFLYKKITTRICYKLVYSRLIKTICTSTCMKSLISVDLTPEMHGTVVPLLVKLFYIKWFIVEFRAYLVWAEKTVSMSHRLRHWGSF